MDRHFERSETNSGPLWRRLRGVCHGIVAIVITVGCQPVFADGTGELAGTIGLESPDYARLCSIYIDGPGLPATPTNTARMMQKNKKFLPDLVIVVVGSTVAFPNEDKLLHNVFSVKPGLEFDLGLYQSGTSKTHTFTRPGATDVFCNIHPDMFASILVVPSDLHTQPEPSGAYRIKGIPPGKYKAVGWITLGEAMEKPIEILAGQTTKLDMSLPAPSRTKNHARKDGSAYGRYKD